MKKLILSLFVLSIFSIGSANAQLITSSQGIIREYVEEVEPEPEVITQPKTILREGLMLDVSGTFAFSLEEDGHYGLMFSASSMVVPANLYVGAGVGIGGCYDSYDGDSDDSGSVLFAPIYGHTRYYMFNKEITPFVDCKAGYNLGNKSLFFEAGIGVTFNKLYFSTSLAGLVDDLPGFAFHIGYNF